MHNPFSVLPRVGVSPIRRILATALASAMVMMVLVRPTVYAVASGDTRSLNMIHLHTGESINIVYKRNGSYDSAALKKIDWFLRDWRQNQAVRMDPRVLDTLWLVYRTVGASQPINIVCGYRSPGTNSMLRRRSRGVAEFSQHTLGKAIDFSIPGVPLSKVRVAGLRLQRGGIGYYPTSGSPFVHMDAGNVRMWPRMSRGELASVFPDGKTVLLPRDGRPMPNYQVAMNEIRRNGSAGGGQGRGEDDAGDNDGGFFAALFGSRSSSDDTPPRFLVQDNRGSRLPAQRAPRPAPGLTQMAMADPDVSPQAPKRIALVPLPQGRPSDIDTEQAQDPATVQMTAAGAGLRMPWQAGPTGAHAEMASNIPLPPVRPGTNRDNSQATPQQMAALDDTLSRASQHIVNPKPTILADLSQDSESFMKRNFYSRQSHPAISYADLMAATNTARPVRAPLVATRFEKQNFASLSSPVSAARNKQQATLVKPDLATTVSLISPPSRTIVIRFGVVAYQDLRSDKFTGAAVKPLRTASFSPTPDVFTGSIASTK